MAKYSFMLGEYTEDDQVYHFGCRGKCYYITLKDKEGVEQSVYESSNMYEAYDKWKNLKGSKQPAKANTRPSRSQNRREAKKDDETEDHARSNQIADPPFFYSSQPSMNLMVTWIFLTMSPSFSSRSDTSDTGKIYLVLGKLQVDPVKSCLIGIFYCLVQSLALCLAAGQIREITLVVRPFHFYEKPQGIQISYCSPPES